MPLLQHRNRKLHYTTNGAGTPLVLVHGFGEDGRVWNGQAPLAEHCRLIIPDLPGSGASETGDGTMESLAEAIRAVLDAEGVGQCILVGHSMGGYAALAFAEKWPGRLLGLGLFHSTARADSAEKIATRQKGMEFIKTNGAAAFLKTSTPALYHPANRDTKPELIEKHLAEATTSAADALIGYYAGMIARPDRTALLKEVKIPVLFVLGRADNAVPLSDGLAQCHMPSIAQVHLLENAGHMGMRECPELSNKLLTDYVRYINQRTAAE
ncbi:alpha/beta fold hydrolase [Flaviaesturariibacter flavus]|uniref:Alpha/beta fold hydrolase n=1 Tax=Flaviaesturariibacter flavus TaxID=2502780 RepID=A0A4R1B5U9_9BACT|nr:alpha/beta fold hydrolase [Flaviaesturariibacter flavus]TCJ13381.1 alpha/beta fold hydrolase [Flaviaesturariibacter flavus]